MVCSKKMLNGEMSFKKDTEKIVIKSERLDTHCQNRD